LTLVDSCDKKTSLAKDFEIIQIGKKIIKMMPQKIDLAEQLTANFGHHRSGWIYAVQCLRDLHRPGGIILDSFIERTFCWHPRGIQPHRQPWIGFVHVPPHIPTWFYFEQTGEKLFKTEAFQESLPYCRGLFTLSLYLRKYLESQLSLPVDNLVFPTEFPQDRWTWEKFSANKEKKVIQVGWWLRKLHAIYRLPLPGTDYRKIFLSVGHPGLPGLMKIEREILIKQGTFHDSLYDSVQTIDYLPNDAYDRLLSENIVFIELYDASANNTVIECLARNTPLLVNPIEPVIEYLGEDYPFYYRSLEEAAEKLHNMDLILQTYRYLLQHPLKEKLTGQYFLESFVASPIYQSLPAGPGNPAAAGERK